MSDDWGEEPVAEAVSSLARAVRDLGNGNAATQMGAIEAHGMFVKEALNLVSGSLLPLDSLPEMAKAIEDVGYAISTSLDGVADAINKLADATREARNA